MGFSFRAALCALWVSCVTVSGKLPDDYESLTPRKKQVVQYTQVEDTNYGPRKLPGYYPSCAKQLAAIASAFSLGPSFKHKGDEMPSHWFGQRARFIHVRGSVAPVTIQWVPSRFTGIYQEEMSEGLIRLSLAAPPSLAGFTPGMAVKVYLQGQHSINFHVMNSIDGQGGNHNYFQNEFFSVIDEPKRLATKAIGWYFSTLTSTPNILSAKRAASIRADGARVEKPVVPWKMVFVPARGIAISSDATSDFREELGIFAPGTVLYEIYGEDPKGTRERLGRMFITAPLLASSYGDNDLFFAHESETLLK